MSMMSESTVAPGADERAWVHARAAALGLEPGHVHAGALAVGEHGQIFLSTDPAVSALPPHPLPGGGVAFAAEVVAAAPGQMLVVDSPDGRPVLVLAGRLSLAAGSRTRVRAPLDLWAARVEADAGAPIELIGADGTPGGKGDDGPAGSPGNTGGAGQTGHEGKNGGDGPGGRLWFETVSGTVTVIAAGGSGGDGGPGGAGGRGGRGEGGGCEGIPPGNGGPGGPGGPGGNAGQGGTVVIAYGRFESGSAFNLLTRYPRAGAGGRGGGGGAGGVGDGQVGRTGPPGGDGKPGAGPVDPPVFSVRQQQAPP